MFRSVQATFASKYLQQKWCELGRRIEAGFAAVKDDLVRISTSDTTSGYLAQKLVAGAGITLTPQGGGGNETLEVSATGGASWPVPDSVFGIANTLIPSKLFLVDASGQAAGTQTTLYLGGSVSRPFRLPDISGTAVVQQDVTAQVFIGLGVTTALHGSNAGIQYSSVTTNRAQFRGNAYGVANPGPAGITGFKSRGATIGSLAGLSAGDPICRMTAIGVCPDNASLPLAGTITIRVPDAFVPAGQSYLPGEFEVQLAATNGPTNSIRRVLVSTSDGELQTLLGVRAGGQDLVTIPPAQPNLAGGSLWTSGLGSPNGVVSGAVGDLYTNRTGAANTTLWVKETSPTPTTGWVPK